MPETNLKADFERAARRLAELAANDPDVHLPDPLVTSALVSGKLDHAGMVATALSGYAERAALGVRAHEIRHDPATGRAQRAYLPQYDTITYGELARRVEGVASAWKNTDEFRVAPGERIAYISFSGADMATIDLATVYAQAVSVPLQANLPADLMDEALEEVEPVVLVTSVEHLALAIDHAIRQPTIRSVIVIDVDEAVDEEREAIEAARARLKDRTGIALATIRQLVATGSAWPWVPLERSPAGPDLLAMIMYTSGSTGAPKHISITTGGIVIPANASVAFPIGATVVIYNDSATAQTIAITTDTLRQASTANTGTRNLEGYGLATLVKVSATTWVISGAGVS